MSLDIVGAILASRGDWSLPRAVLERDQFSTIAARNDSSTQNNTINLFVDGISPDLKYAASIVTACRDQTVYAIHCTAGPKSIGPATCGPNAPVGTITEGASQYEYTLSSVTQTLGYDVTVTASEYCTLKGTTEADCSATIGGTVQGTSTAKSTAGTLAGKSYHRYDVEITGGAEKTANPTATCAGGGTNMAPGLNLKNIVLWSLLGAVSASNFVLL